MVSIIQNEMSSSIKHFHSYSEGSQYFKYKFAYLGNPPAWQLPLIKT